MASFIEGIKSAFVNKRVELVLDSYNCLIIIYLISSYTLESFIES